MNIFLGMCWFLSYTMTFISFVLWAWRWSDEIATAQATFFWFVLTVILGLIGGYITLSISDNR